TAAREGPGRGWRGPCPGRWWGRPRPSGRSARPRGRGRTGGTPRPREAPARGQVCRIPETGTGSGRPQCGTRGRWRATMGAMADRTFAVVGAGIAAGAAVYTLRTEGFDGRIVLVGDESHPPYERPPLSKEYLRGEVEAGSFVLQPEAWYAENDVDFRA